MQRLSIRSTLAQLSASTASKIAMSLPVCLFSLLLSCHVNANAPYLSYQAQNTPEQIDPNIERRDIKEFDIDTEDFEIGLFAGVISIEDFGSDLTTGLRLSYHLNENIFVEASYAQATAGETSFEVLSGGVPFLTEDQRDFKYYDVSAAYNLNGELFLTDNWVFNTDFFLILGAGATEFGGDERFTINVGAGYRLLVTDYLSVRFDVRDHIFNSDIIGPEKSVHNVSYTLSLSAFF